MYNCNVNVINIMERALQCHCLVSVTDRGKAITTVSVLTCAHGKSSGWRTK